jgi:bacteriophage CI repressor helix-turn-helix domain
VKGEHIMYEIFSELLQKYGVTPYKVSKETGVSQSTLSDWKRGISTPKPDKLQKIADYFGVPLTYLLTGNAPEQKKEKSSELNSKDERDIAKDLDSIMEKLSTGESGPASYNGEELDPEAAELFRDELEIALRRLKIINKEKYTPKKYKK